MLRRFDWDDVYNTITESEHGDYYLKCDVDPVLAALEAEIGELKTLEPGNKDLRDTLILRNETIDLLIQENQLLKSNLENANENWRRVLEERDELEALLKERSE